MSHTPREIGTLVVVILKAQHLPNKQRIGKQAPYCCITLNGEKRRTRAIKRGGQHPEWDEEVRFTLYEDTEDILARSAQENANGNGSGTPPPVPSKIVSKRKKIKGGNAMLVTCYAEDPKEPELIGEALVDLTEVLTKGETDEWFSLENKTKYSGEVYLELTFWSNERPPERKKKPRASMPNYGGPGSFMPSDSDNSFSSLDSRASLPESLKTNSSLGRLDLYTPTYGVTVRAHATGSMERLTDEFGGLNVHDSQNNGRRRESFPPPRTGHTPRPNESTLSSVSSYLSSRSDSRSRSSSPTTPVPRNHHRHSLGGPGQTFPTYQSPYDAADNGISSSHSQVRSDYASSIYSTPSASSGFGSVPSASSGFAAIHPQTSSGFQPVQMQSHTPAPYHYTQQPSIFPSAPMASGPSGFAISQYPTPPSSGFAPPPSSMGYHQPQQQMYTGYQQYPVPPSSAPPSMFPQATSASNIPNPPHSAPPQQYQNGPAQPPAPIQYTGYAPTTPPHVQQQKQPPAQVSQQYNPPPPIQNSGSRPLPQPSVQNGNGMLPTMTPPPPSAHAVFSASQSQQGYSPPQCGYANTPPQMLIPGQAPAPSSSHPLPVPPGPPLQPQITAGSALVVHNQYIQPQHAQQQQQQNGFVAPPPPPSLRSVSGPASSFQKTDSRGSSPNRPPLPQPPQHASISVPNHSMGSNMPFPGSNMQAGSGFQVPPPPPLPKQRAVSVSMSMATNPLPHLQQAQIPDQQRMSIIPGEIYNYGIQPQPPHMTYQTNGAWNGQQSQ